MTIKERIDQIKHDICQRALQSNRLEKSVSLLAVSKKHSNNAIREAHTAGQHSFGENYLQEALSKIKELDDLAIDWHFIGAIQSNKTRDIALNFSWVHTVDRLKIAKRLSDQRPSTLSPLNICLQVNIDNEPSKAGTPPEQVISLALAIAGLPNIRLRGLMAIPNPELMTPDNDDLSNDTRNSNAFARLNAMQQSLKTHPSLNHLDTLSMGMSADMNAAIQHGATIVRVGTAIFGKRPADTSKSIEI